MRLPREDDPLRLLQPDDHVDGGDARPLGGGNVDRRSPLVGDVGQLFQVLAIEMEMRTGLRVVPELGVVDGDLAQKPATGKFVERVIDRAERRGETDRARLPVDHLGGEVPVVATKDHTSEVDPLPRRTDTRAFELAADEAVDRLPLRFPR